MSPTRQAVRGCAEWLAACVRLGWQKSDLDALEALWWKYHDERGNLVTDGNQRAGSEASGDNHGSEAR